MPQVHSSASLEGDVHLADDVVIGPHCIIDATLGPVRIGSGTRLRGHVYINGPVTIGANNRIYPFVSIGFAPQSISFDHDKPGRGVVIGDGNTLRESVTIHRAMTDAGPTTIANNNYFMVNSHAGHDCIVGSNCMFANGSLLAGHVTVEDRVVLGGNAGVHQFCRVGHHAMLSGNAGASRDIPPCFTVTEVNLAASINVIGLRRGGYSREQIDTVKWVYKVLCREQHALTTAVERLRERADEPIVREYLNFIAASKRGICTGRLSTGRGGGGATTTEETTS